MGTFLLFGKYSADALQKMSPRRTEMAVSLIGKHGGKVQSMYALLGPYDLVLIVSFPDIAAAMRASVALGKATGIGFTTAPAVAVEEFDRMIQEG